MPRYPAAILALVLLLPPDAAAQRLDSVTASLDFRSVGPSRGGRVTAVAGHAATPGTFYMGATGGGVWKTTDWGQTWVNVSDGHFESPSIGSIDVADSDPDVVYVGTGSDGIRSNVIIGRGIYRSDDAGATWRFLGLRDTGQIGAVVVHPTNPDVVWVAALGSPFGPGRERGVYHSVDGGTTWRHALFVSERTGAIDLELNPADPDEVYAALWFAERKPWTIISGDDRESGIYKSADGGATWRKVTAGLPEGLVGKIDLAVSPADPSRVYALVEARPEDEGLYRSNDRGETWVHVSNEGGLMRRPFYYTNVDVDPTDPDVLYVGNEGFFRSADGGATWERRPTPHGDNHDLWIDPTDPDVWIQSNDGGVNVTRDGGRTWSTQHNQSTAELYQVHADDRFPYWLYAGQQDNSTISLPALPVTPPRGGRAGDHTAWWEEVGGCETGPVVPKPGNAEVVYANCKGRFGVYDRRTGQERQYYVGAVDLYGVNPAELPYRFQRVVPIEVSPHDPDVVYHGSQYVHRTEDGGGTWERISPDLTAFRPERQMASGGPITRDITGEEHYSALYVIEESPLEPGVIWAGANDGPVHVTRDGGTTWTDVTPPMPPEGRVNGIDVSPHRPGTAYVAVYRYLLDDFAPYAFRTDDYGATWVRITDGLPVDSPVRVVREDPERANLLYAGTDTGLFVSLDDGASWSAFQGDLPVTPVTDLKLHRGDLVLSTMGRGFWVLDDLSWLRQWTGGSAAQLFRPRDAWRMRYSTGRRTPDAPEYLPAGAVIWYRLPAEADVELDILEASGSVLRSFASAETAAAPAAPEQGMRAPVSPEIERGALESGPGLHRFIWDLRHPGPETSGERSARGPMAVPGAYRVRLRVGNEVFEQPLTLQADPRVIAAGVTPADLEQQLAHNLAVRDLISTFRGGLERLGAAIDSTDGSRRQALEALRDEVVTDEDASYPPRRLDAQLSYLASMTMMADQAPGRDAVERLEQRRVEVAAFLERLDEVLRD